MENNTTNNMTEKSADTVPLNLEASVRPITPDKNLLAFASVKINEAFVIDGIRVISGEKGLFVAMPSTKGKDDRYHDIAFPITAEARKLLNETVLDGYAAAVNRLQDIGRAQGEFAKKPPIEEQLRASAAKAAERAAAKPVPAANRGKSAAAEH